MNYPGKLTIEPVSAKIITRPQAWLQQTNLFLVFKFQNQIQRSSESKGIATNIVWNDLLYFNRLFGHTLQIILIDHKNDKIGSTQINISEVLQKTEPTSRCIDLFRDDSMSASIRIDMFFQPVLPQVIPRNVFKGENFTQKQNTFVPYMPDCRSQNQMYQIRQKNINQQLPLILNNIYNSGQHLTAKCVQQTLARQFGFQFVNDITKRKLPAQYGRNSMQKQEPNDVKPTSKKTKILNQQKYYFPSQEKPQIKHPRDEIDISSEFTADQMDSMLS